MIRLKLVVGSFAFVELVVTVVNNSQNKFTYIFGNFPFLTGWTSLLLESKVTKRRIPCYYPEN